eukprot:CAMPEP_0172541184 /NCGR_PEP_ID=MMETSP1067-20121228/12037_1 /TAXON_ID=265564 ORGANISM="Thalassiosira punctigera, Strain Tpunct2005C2" /NCGR_SAMPLE_ID=MMETSP1067 /ASSEMBLY_ACC=CAM_ASM_000444 /LENGTH=306 /DNA_ID=CAMNT_0013327169 /DNA_START=104 /DNA_END=1024 /DNA_ORIENTATION=-
MAAIRTFGEAFVTDASRRLSSCAAAAAPAAVRSAQTTDHGPIRPRSLLGIASLRGASSSAFRTSIRPLVVCGPSGVGKGSIISKFMERAGAEDFKLPEFCFSVSHTTRQPRQGEIDGVHYHFVTREFMLEKIASGAFFIEHAEVHGNLYGTSFQALCDVSYVEPTKGYEIAKNSGRDRQCLLDIDVEGVRSIKEYQSIHQREKKEKLVWGEEGATRQSLSEVERDALPEIDARFVFVAPPSVDVLAKRLAGRGTETSESLERRVRNAQAELEYGLGPGNFNAIVVNDDLDRACAEFERIVEGLYLG